MKKIKISLLMLMVFSMSACSMFRSQETTQTPSTDNVVEDTKTETEESISNIFTHFDENNIEYSEKEKLDNMDFAAEEGYSFRFDNEYVYLYRMNSEDTMMQEILDEANNRGILTATQNGVDQDYKAVVNGNYIMIYNQEASLDELQSKFKEYK